ncbi:MAG: flagellar biosynthesis anti-sigma factor FlgM [Treponema sp.]|jgi:negative regulator of flagellin synthesis FlgM|nr:flagellar biosynthesis anti-sigma factor FlgM [Treponema sp.]
MTVDRIGPLDPIQPGKKPGRSGQVSRSENTDSIHLSSEALEKSELHQARELVFASADVRAERIQEMKSKLNDPSYINETVLKATADKIMDVWGV